MNTNPIAGRAFICMGYPPGGEEASIPDPALTVATVIFCVVGPFWLITQLARQVIWEREPFPQQANQ